MVHFQLKNASAILGAIICASILSFASASDPPCTSLVLETEESASSLGIYLDVYDNTATPAAAHGICYASTDSFDGTSIATMSCGPESLPTPEYSLMAGNLEVTKAGTDNYVIFSTPSPSAPVVTMTAVLKTVTTVMALGEDSSTSSLVETIHAFSTGNCQTISGT